MRMLTTYLSPTSGRASLAGHDVLDEPLEVRRKVGYLPENVPLYPEMRVIEYLRYRARLKDVPRSRAAPGDRRGREPVSARRGRKPDHRPALARIPPAGRPGRGDGARPRDPDPRRADGRPRSLQIREVRDLIRELGERHTILLSTHILSEVEAVCGRVIIIARGRIALDDQLANLRRQSRDRRWRPAVRPTRSGRALQTIPGVERVVAGSSRRRLRLV